MPRLLCKGELDNWPHWKQALESRMPELDVQIWPDMRDPQKIEYVVIWTPVDDILQSLPNLKVIFSLGAGVDHLLQQQGMRLDLPIVRMVDPALTEGVSEYVLFHVLRYHRRMPEYDALQRERRWRQLRQISPQERKVGIMGLGVIGADVAVKLAALGFDVAGWSRISGGTLGIECFQGQEQLTPFLARTEILICLLPLTAETDGIINRQTLAALPQGAYLINAARGGHVVENDLLAALDSGHIAGATLDVFASEPLPEDHPFWDHPKVTVTPHIASLTNPSTASAQIIDNIRRHQRGEPFTDLVNVKRGY